MFVCDKDFSCCGFRYWDRWEDVEQDAKECGHLIEVAPVVHGEWVDHMCRDWRCSECGEPIKKVRNVDGYCYDDKPNFCPNCGADMRERKGDDG